MTSEWRGVIGWIVAVSVSACGSATTDPGGDAAAPIDAAAQDGAAHDAAAQDAATQDGAAQDAATQDASATDAGLDADAGCPNGEMLLYKSPGCDVKPVCSPPPPPCAEEFCGCDGKTITGCGATGAPYVHKGACADADASSD